MITLDQFSYSLPSDRIAHAPAQPRDQSKLLVLDRNSGNIQHAIFADLANFLRPGDILVRNNTKVFPARLIGHKKSGGRVEVLLIKPVDNERQNWECLTKPGLKLDQEVLFVQSTSDQTLTGNYQPSRKKPPSPLLARCVENRNTTRILRFNQADKNLLTLIDQFGQTPLPPYIHSGDTEEHLRTQYQTHYAQTTGSVAAPTAGLHFTPELDNRLRVKGIEIEEITLHVGLGTFQPVKSERIEEHTMHSEWFSLNQATAERLNQAKLSGRRIIAVGTTSCRVLESCAQSRNGESNKSSSNGKNRDAILKKNTLLQSTTGETDIFIYPPYQFRFVDGLITNFHLPHSTLLMLVSAFVTTPNTEHKFTSFLESSVGKAYQTALQQNYRFFSFGDGMLIV